MIRRGRTTTFQKRLEITDGPPPDSPTQRLRLRSVARSGRCANGGAVVNTRGAPASTPRWAAPLPDHSALFRRACVMPSCTCAGRIQVGGLLPC